jgi:lipopolysaccharide transport system ATP-binding protein
MAGAAISIEGLSKQYRVGATHPSGATFYDMLSGWLKPGRRTPVQDPREFWALRSLTLEVAPGEVLGVVGRNGAGKSTLLKILARITAPTEGRVTLHGRVASLLEVGTGFHPELTGRENIYLNATILGMKRAEIDRKLDAIVDFSGVAKFLDTPVKRYSSGMYVRLAFAVAAHVDADILLVDEVLAVGDAEFQKRSLGMMGDVARRGRTVLFVSHNLTALRNLCTTGLLLDQGRQCAIGPIGDVLAEYDAAGRSGAGLEVTLPRAGTGPASLRRVRVVAPDSAPALFAGAPLRIEVDVDVGEAMELAVFIHCNESSGTRVFSSGSFFDRALVHQRVEAGEYRFCCRIPPDLLNAGEFSLDVSLVRGRTDVFEAEHGLLQFHVNDIPTGVPGWNWPVQGVTRPRLAWSCEALAPAVTEAP